MLTDRQCCTSKLISNGSLSVLLIDIREPVADSNLGVAPKTG